MHFNPEVRKEVKGEAAGKVLGRFGFAILACAVCRLPALLIGFLLPLAGLVDQVNSMRQMLLDSSASLPQLAALGSALWSRMVLMILATAVFNLFLIGPLHMGLRNYQIKLYRGNTPALLETVSCFSSGKAYARAFSTNLWITLRWLRWMLLLFPALFLLGVLAKMGTIMLVLGILVYLVFVVWVGVKVQSYDGAYNFLYDAPEMPPRETVRLADILFRGHLGELLVFLLSFLGWALLLSLPGYALSYLGYGTLGTLVDFALGLVLVAYQGTAFAGYVDALRKTGTPDDQPPCMGET